jgi:molecular chaperone GrpE
MLVGDADMMDSELETAADGTADIAALRAQRDEYLELAKRERADFDNYRKRIEREMGQIKRESLAGFLKNFFDPLADLDRALAESDRTKSFEALLTGVRMMRDNFRQTLEKAGVRKIEAEGKPFDPALHEAVTMIPSADKPPNTVVEVFDNGYVMDDFVLHPAKVAVSRSPDTA